MAMPKLRGPNGYRSVARLVANSELTSNYTVATYEIDAPGGNWDQADEGKYQIGLLSSEVADVQGNYVDASTVVRFNFAMLTASLYRAVPGLADSQF